MILKLTQARIGLGATRDIATLSRCQSSFVVGALEEPIGLSTLCHYRLSSPTASDSGRQALTARSDEIPTGKSDSSPRQRPTFMQAFGPRIAWPESESEVGPVVT